MMNPRAYAEKMDALLEGVPAPVAAFIRHESYERGHSSGYEEIINVAGNLLYALKDVRQEMDTLKQAKSDFRLPVAASAVYDGTMLDLTRPNAGVQIQTNHNGTIVWVNIGPTCVLRMCQVEELTINTPMLDTKITGE